MVAAPELVTGWDVASDTVVAASTRTAAMPTAVSAAHHSRAAVPMAETRSDIRSFQLLMAHSSRSSGRSLRRRCQPPVTWVLGKCEPEVGTLPEPAATLDKGNP